MVALKLVSNTDYIPAYITRRECVSTLRLHAIKENNEHAIGPTRIGSGKHFLEEAERDFSDLQISVANGTAKQEHLLHGVQRLNTCCDCLCDAYRQLLNVYLEGGAFPVGPGVARTTDLSEKPPFIEHTDADLGEIAQMAELKEVLINARARKVMMDYCGKNLTTAAERITTGADLAWAEREFEYTAEGWIRFKKELADQLAKLV